MTENAWATRNAIRCEKRDNAKANAKGANTTNVGTMLYTSVDLVWGCARRGDRGRFFGCYPALDPQLDRIEAR